MKKSIRYILWDILNHDDDLQSRIFDFCLTVLILANILAVIASTFKDFSAVHSVGLYRFELVSVIIFTIEYVLRVWIANHTYPNSKHPHIKFIFSAMAIIDLAAILPFYLPLTFFVDLRMLRILRVLRIFRIFKLSRYVNAMNTIGRVLKKEKEKIITSIGLIILMIFVASTIMFYAENAAQPEVFKNILDSTWWAVGIFTSIWLGDVYPITIVGKIFGGIISLLGLMLVSIPTGIISSGFIDELNHKTKVCPHCGKKIE